MFDHVFPVGFIEDDLLISGEGLFCRARSGREYLDLNSGQFCAVSGHSSDILRNAMEDILASIQDTHTSLLSAPAVDGINDLCRVSKLEIAKAILLSTGSEASEFAFRYAKHITGKHGGCSLDLGYHGITYGGAMYSLSREKLRPPPSLSFTAYAPRSTEKDRAGKSVDECLYHLNQLFSQHHQEIAFFVLEPVISGGGMIWLPDDYLNGVRQLCDEYEILLIFDECQTGMGRLGRWFSFTDRSCQPDMLICGKALGMGFPVSAVIVSGKKFKFSNVHLPHFSSHQNEGFAGVLVSALISWVERENILVSNSTVGDYFKDRLGSTLIPYGGLQLRGEGLMLGFDLNRMDPTQAAVSNGNAFIKSCMDNGLLLQHCNYGRTIRILPAYITTPKHIDQFCELLNQSIIEFIQSGGIIYSDT